MKTKIKTKKLAALFLTLVLALGLLPMSTFVDAAISNDSRASIVVGGAVKDDTLTLYKLINVTYIGNAFTYAWSPDFEDYFNTYFGGKTAEDFFNLGDDSEELKTLLLDLTAYIDINAIECVSTKDVKNNDEPVMFENLAMGEYFIRPTSSTSVYKPMLPKIEPTYDDDTGEYELADTVECRAKLMDNVNEASTASITVKNAVENDTLAAYKVIDITYKAATNVLTYEWNENFKAYFAGTTSYNNTAYTVEQFGELTNDSDDLKNLLAQLPNYIADRNITPVGTQTVDEYGEATFESLKMGEYFIRPTSSTSVYQLMLQKIEPTVVSGKYVIDDVAFVAKHNEINITKAADKTSVTKGEKVNYTITVDIPTYDTGATDKSFYVADFLPDGLTLDTNSITVKRDGTDITSGAGTQYTLDKTANSITEPYYTFKLSVNTTNYTNNWSAKGGKQLVITYAATLNDNTAVNVEETNTATLDYSYYPYVQNSRKQLIASVDVTTYGIEVYKYTLKNGKEEIPLAGATFDLYRTATTAEINDGLATEIPNTTPTLKGIKLDRDFVTSAEGTVTFEKYEANGTKYDYYLVETKAPSGYNLLEEPQKVNFTDNDVAETEGIYTVAVLNSKGIVLPTTGGAGTVIFTVIGISLMIGAVVLFVVSKKKGRN